jgi:hypothetical protein
MKQRNCIHALLGLRNRLHAALPETCEKLESVRKMLQFRRTILDAGFRYPLPPFVKRSVLKRAALDYSLRALVETGTQYGDTPWFFRDEMEEIWTVELSPDLAHLARRRFARFPSINVVEGDSAVKLREIVPKLRHPVLFWLDGHYSAGVTARGSSDCPIYEELRCVFENCTQRWVVLIDDARCFGSEKDYPDLPELAKFVESALPGAEFSTQHDMIKIVPRA